MNIKLRNMHDTDAFYIKPAAKVITNLSRACVAIVYTRWPFPLQDRAQNKALINVV